MPQNDLINFSHLVFHSRYIALEHENKQWRQQLLSSQQHLTPDPVSDSLPAAATDSGPSLVLKPDSYLGGPQVVPLAYPQHHLPLMGSTKGAIMGGSDGTKPQTLKGITVTGDEIDDLFAL